MTLNNPFTNGQIKNYLLLYASIVVIMILFFIASTLFNDIGDVDKKIFDTQKSQEKLRVQGKEGVQDTTPTFKLLDKAY